MTNPLSGSCPTYPIRSTRSRGGGAHDALPVEQHVSAQPAPAEARHEPGDHAEQRGLADAGATGEDDELALLDGQVDPVEDERLLVVADRHVAQLDHGATAPVRSRSLAGGRRAAAGPSGTELVGGGAATAGTRPISTPTSASTLSVGATSTPGWATKRSVRTTRRRARGDEDAREGHDHLGQPPVVRPVARALHPATGAPQPHDRHDRAQRQHRQREQARGGQVEDGVGADADAEQPDDEQGAGAVALAAVQPGGAAVAAGVHAGRQGQRALEGVLEHRHQEASQPPDPAGGATAQRLGGADPAHAVGQLREHRDRDDQRGPDLVERRRHRLEQPLGVGQRVGRADADDDGGQPQPVVQPGQQRLPRDRPEQADPGHPARAAGPRAGRSAPRPPSTPPNSSRNTTRITTITRPSQR